MPDLGKKYTCYSCHTKFYDLGKPVPLCPKCGADQRDAEEAPAVPASRSRSRAAAAAAAAAVVEEPIDEPEFAEGEGPSGGNEDEEEVVPEREEPEEDDEDEEEEEY